ncbi:MAG: threonine synthase [bacterium]|nr:threonine synthase [bacterium]
MTTDAITHLQCTICAAHHQPEPGRYTCDDCGEAGTLDVRYDYDLVGTTLNQESLAANRDITMFRYSDLLPIAPNAVPTPLTVGGTPLYLAPILASKVGVRSLWIKDEGREPTASMKDRASAIAILKAQEQGAEIITTASTGNAAAALAGIAASVGQKSVIFVPASAPQAKVAQLLAFGATVVLVDGNYNDAFELATEAVGKWGWYNRNTGVNPYVAEGKKTVALEIVEQLGFSPPDAIFVSVGDGSIIGGVHKGLKDALALGWIDTMPRIYGIQAAGSDYMMRAFESGVDVATMPAINAATAADSISADLPRDRVKALAAVTETGGAYLRVEDDHILRAIPEIAAATGVFAEPAASAAYAGLEVASQQGLVGPEDHVVVISTGSGLKDVPSVLAGVSAIGAEPIRVPPSLGALETAMDR